MANRNEAKVRKLMQYGLDNVLAEKLVKRRYGVTKLRVTTINEIAQIVGVQKARQIKTAITRAPIPDDTLIKLINECDWSCCLCWDIDKIQPVIVHHIVPYEETQDNAYDNLVVLCPTHHAEAHSKSDLTGVLLPIQKLRQKKKDFVDAIAKAKKGNRAFPGREPHIAYEWGTILDNCHHQTKASLNTYLNKYDSELYVNRDIEREFYKFIESAKLGFLIVDKSGQGKSTLVCSLVSRFINEGKAVVLIRGDQHLVDENGYEKLLCKSLGYDPANYQMHLRHVAQALSSQNQVCCVFIDGISENNNLSIANRALSNLIGNLQQLTHFKLCITSRDVIWNSFSHDLPLSHFYIRYPNTSVADPRHFIGELSDKELEMCLDLYKSQYQIDFSPSDTANTQLRSPLMLRLFCEAYQGETLGTVSSIPVHKTFDLYLSNKMQAIFYRLGYALNQNLLLRILRNVAYLMWKSDDAKSLDESSWSNFLPNSDLDSERILKEYENEGFIEIHEDTITLSRKLHFVFDKLREYL